MPKVEPSSSSVFPTIPNFVTFGFYNLRLSIRAVADLEGGHMGD